MATDSPVPADIQLRYGSAKVFERPDTRAPEVGELTRDDAFSVLGTESSYFHVQLRGGSLGYVYASNLVGADLPPTALEQETALRRAAEAAHAGGGWRGALKRRFGR